MTHSAFHSPPGALRAAPVDAPRAMLGGRGWPGAWIAALAVFTAIVIRVQELVPQLALIRPTILVAGAALVAHFVNSRPVAWQQALRERQFRLAAAYIGTIYLMIPFAIWKGKAVGIANAQPFGLLVILMLLMVPPTRAAFDRVTFGVVTITTAYALGVLARNLQVGGDRLTSGGMYDPNDLAALLLMAMQLALGIVLRKEAAWKRLFAMGCAGVLCFAMLRTSSRGGMLALGVGTLTLLLALPPKRLLVFALAITLVSPVAWRIAPATFQERALSLFALEEDYNTTSTSGRTYLWKRGLAFFASSPVIGVGAGSFELRLGEDFKERTGGVGAWHTAHNSYVQVMVELGIVGISLLVAMLFRALRVGWQLARRPKGGQEGRLYRPELLAAVVSFCTSAFFLSHGYSFLLYGIVALSAMAIRVCAAETGGANLPTGLAPVPGTMRRIAGRRGGLAFQPAVDPHAASTRPRR